MNCLTSNWSVSQLRPQSSSKCGDLPCRLPENALVPEGTRHAPSIFQSLKVRLSSEMGFESYYFWYGNTTKPTRHILPIYQPFISLYVNCTDGMIIRYFVCAVSLALLIGLKITETADVRPKIYIYDGLPDKWRDSTKYGHEMDYPGNFYALDRIFPELLRASPYYTNNSAEADYFYVSSYPWKELPIPFQLNMDFFPLPCRCMHGKFLWSV